MRCNVLSGYKKIAVEQENSTQVVICLATYYFLGGDGLRSSLGGCCCVLFRGSLRLLLFFGMLVFYATHCVAHYHDHAAVETRCSLLPRCSRVCPGSGCCCCGRPPPEDGCFCCGDSLPRNGVFIQPYPVNADWSDPTSTNSGSTSLGLVLWSFHCFQFFPGWCPDN